MSFATIKTDILAFESAWTARKPGAIIRAGSTVLNDTADVVELFEAGPNDEADKKACADCCDRLSKAQAMNATPEDVGKLFPGDGSFLKMLLELIIKLAPLFIKPTPAPAG